MRGADGCNESLRSTVRLKQCVSRTRPLRPIRHGKTKRSRRWMPGFRRCPHESRSDGDSRCIARAMRAPALPSYLGHVLTDNRRGRVVNAQASRANGRAEREVAAQMLHCKVMVLDLEACVLTLPCPARLPDNLAIPCPGLAAPDSIHVAALIGYPFDFEFFAKAQNKIKESHSQSMPSRRPSTRQDSL